MDDAPQTPGKTVMIVEDNTMNMKLFVDILTIHGFRTVGTGDGAEAVGLARAEAPDLILMDIQLPGMDGREVTRALKAEADLAHIPVVAVTACTMKGDEDAFRACGCADYLAKPFALPDLVALVRRYTGTDTNANEEEGGA